jgi:hypothetical protein
VVAAEARTTGARGDGSSHRWKVSVRGRGRGRSSWRRPKREGTNEKRTDAVEGQAAEGAGEAAGLLGAVDGDDADGDDVVVAVVVVGDAGVVGSVVGVAGIAGIAGVGGVAGVAEEACDETEGAKRHARQPADDDPCPDQSEARPRQGVVVR